MAVKCRIGFVRDDGSVISTKCTNNGDYRHVGRILLQYWTDPSEIEELCSCGGEINDLAYNITQQRYALGNKPSKVFTCDYEMKKWDPLYEDYLYVFKNNKWYGCESEFTEERHFRELKTILHVIDNEPTR